MDIYLFRNILIILMGIIFLRAILSSRRGKYLSSKEFNIIKKNLAYMDARTFEFFCTELFKEMGFKSYTTKASRDGGKDVILKDSKGRTYYVECKKYSGSVSSTIANKLYGVAAADRVYRAKLITTGRFTEDCLKFCRKVGIECIDTEKILEFVKRYGRTTLLKYK